MSLDSQKILGIVVSTSTRQNILEEINKYLFHASKTVSKSKKSGRKPFIIVTPNPEQVVFAQSHEDFRNILNRADVALPDGVGIPLAAKFLGIKHQVSRVRKNVERIPGVEFMDDLVEMAQKQGASIGLIGGYGDLAVNALERLRQKHPALTGWAEPGPILSGGPKTAIDALPNEYFAALAHRIKKTKTRILFVGLGAPKQEYFIDRIRCHVSGITMREHVTQNITHDTLTLDAPLVLMSVGGSFDFLAGRLKRAPVFIRSIGFEWAWRLVQEPWRWKRQLALLSFIGLLLKAKMRIKPSA